MPLILAVLCVLFSLMGSGAARQKGAASAELWQYAYAGTEHHYLEAVSGYLLQYNRDHLELRDGMIPCFTSLEIDSEDEKDIKFWGIFDLYNYSLREETLIEENGKRLLGLFRLEQAADGSCTVKDAAFAEEGDAAAIAALCEGHEMALEGMLHPVVSEESRRWYIAQFVEASDIQAKYYLGAGQEALPLRYETKPSPAWVAALPEAAETDCILVVDITVGSNAVLTMHEKNAAGVWEQSLDDAAFIGKNGGCKTREGDGKTPLGSFNFNAALGILDDPGCPLPYTRVNDSHYWVCDSGSPRYNTLVSTDEYTDFDRARSEHIIDYPNAYRYILNTTYNAGGSPGLGSAIFLHCYREQRTYTFGCVSIPFESMEYVMTHIRPDARILIRQTPGRTEAGEEGVPFP